MNDAPQRLRFPAGNLDPAGASASGLRVMLDASALLKRYASEAGHERVLDVFAQADVLLVAAHCQSEVAAALLRRRRDGCLSEAEFERVWAAARSDVADMVRVPLDDHVERFAFAAMEHEPPGRSQGESRSAPHAGFLDKPPGRSQGESRSAPHAGFLDKPPGRSQGESRSAPHAGFLDKPPGRSQGKSRSAPLRVTDALHVGSALAANVDLFVTADWRLVQIARAMGLPAECLDAAAQTNRKEAVTP